MLFVDTSTTSQELNASFEYKKDYNVSLDVYYITDGFVDYNQTLLNGLIPVSSAGITAANSTNIKMLTATIVSAENEKVVLRSFLTNIGEYKIYHKTVLP